jgi:hypothetical protein
MIGCAGSPAKRVETLPEHRLQWLRAEVARAELLSQGMRGSFAPPASGADMVCSLAIAIDAWYGVGDERWELTNADVVPDIMLPVRPTSNMREELARIGIRDCVLDLNR